MGKVQDWSVTTCLFLFLFQASQIHCTSQTQVLNRMYRLRRGIGSSVDTNHLNAIRRLSMSSLQNIIGVNQQELRERDRIENLSGQPPVDFRQYSGYVTVDESARRSLFYYFVEATKTKDSSPLVLWLNGGPGCSSLYGAFQELGPFRIHSDGKTLYTNPYSWNNEANILFLESPAGTGFSYTESDMENLGDMETAADNYVFLVKWLERFPEFKGREFYIAGESYAGHYVPQLAQTILAHNNNKTFINLRGILIGNPSIDDEADSIGAYEFLVSHAIISKKTFLSFEKNCRGDTVNGTECLDMSMKMEDARDELNKYNILAPKCVNATLTNQSKECTTVMQYDPCGEHYMTAYFNLPEVQRSMHVTKLPYTWVLCSDIAITWSQRDASASMLPILKELMSHEHLRVWVYSGDMDAVISVTTTMYALKMMNLTVVKEWLPWFSEGQVGGYTEEYRGNVRFATVRGAGHEVPLYKPKPALTLFKQFILNSPLPLTP